MTEIRSYLALILFFLLPVHLFSEENNPCLHASWSDELYECSTWVSGAEVSVNCHTTVVVATSQIQAASTKGGNCMKYRICQICGERDNLGENSFSDISCGQLSCTTDPGGHVEGSGSCEVYAVCHEKRSSTGTVNAARHEYQLLTDEKHTGGYKCHMTGSLKYDKQSVSLSEFAIPVGTTKCFDVSWARPSSNEPSDGRNEYSYKECRNCNKDCSNCEKKCIWGTPTVTRMHDAKYGETPASNAERVSCSGGHGFHFPDPGEYYVKFTKRCIPYQTSLLPDGWNQQTIVGGCKQGEYEFTVTAVGVESLDWSAPENRVHFRERGEEPPEKTLYVLSEISEEAAQYNGNRPRPVTPIDFETRPTGDSWPSVHPVLGGLDDSSLSAWEREQKASYAWPHWESYHINCSYPYCREEHYEFSGEAGSADARFIGRSPGVYTVAVSCGTAENPEDPNDNTGVRRRFISVCNPVAAISFAVQPNASGRKVLDKQTSCNIQPVPITFGGDMNGIPEGEKAYLNIDATPGTYELYRDQACAIKAGASDRVLEVTAEKNVGHSICCLFAVMPTCFPALIGRL